LVHWGNNAQRAGEQEKSFKRLRGITPKKKKGLRGRGTPIGGRGKPKKKRRGESI